MAGQTGDIVQDAVGDESGEPRRRTDGAERKREERITIAAPRGILWLGGQGANGSVVLFDAAEQVNNTANNATIWLSGQSGDIVLRNAAAPRSSISRMSQAPSLAPSW